MGVQFTPLTTEEREKLYNALELNATRDQAITMGKNTSFIGSDGSVDPITDDEVINAIKSLPTHY